MGHLCVLKLRAGMWKAEWEQEPSVGQQGRGVPAWVAGLEATQGTAPSGPVVLSRLQGW